MVQIPLRANQITWSDDAGEEDDGDEKALGHVA